MGLVLFFTILSLFGSSSTYSSGIHAASVVLIIPLIIGELTYFQHISHPTEIKEAILLKVFSENKEKIKKIRLILFVLLAITASLAIIMNKSFAISYICYFLFLLKLANLDIAFLLTTPEEKKQLWQQFKSQNWKKILLKIIIYIGLLISVYFISIAAWSRFWSDISEAQINSFLNFLTFFRYTGK